MTGDLNDRRAIVWGLGVFGGGVAAARYLSSRGAKVRVFDSKPGEELGSSVAALEGLANVELVLGRPQTWADFSGEPLVVKSPAISPTTPLAARLYEEAEVTSELELGLIELGKRGVPFAMVTGSKGKSTTTGLLAEMLSAAGWATEAVGNNERPLLGLAVDGREPERVVIEVSSFMGDALARSRAKGAAFPAPKVLALTSLVPEHLNWHGSVEAYYGAKLSLLHLGPDAVVCPAGDRELRRRVPRAFGREPTYAGPSADFGPGDLNLLGGHNLSNAQVAAAAARAMGTPGEAIAQGVASFQPLPHRLQTVGVSAAGVRFINDSMATTPASAMAALSAVSAPVVLLAGGSDKGAAYNELGRAAAAVHAVVCLGEIREQIAAAIERAVGQGHGGAAVIRSPGTFAEAFEAALVRCPPGGAVLLAPATASYDMFPNFKARGARFAELAERACDYPA